MENLGKLFGSAAKVKIMRLFLLNQEHGFDVSDVADRSRVTPAAARQELSSLTAAGFLKKKSFNKEWTVKKGKKEILKKKRVQGWFFRTDFKYKNALHDLVLDTEFVDLHALGKKLKTLGKMKLVIASGVFIKDPESRLDLLIVGDELRRQPIDTTVRLLEAEIGKELSYAVFDTADFLYRANMYDKLVRDVIDSPHEQILDVGIMNQIPKVSNN
jgi:hypothetical protein